MEARRTTLMSNGPLGNGHAGSALPVPSSAMKKPAMRMGPPRMSVAPNTGGGMRASTIGGGGGGGGGGGMTRMPSQENLQGRPSTMGARAGVDGVSSANRGDGGMYGRPSTVRVAPGSVRRSSVFPGRPSMAPGASLQATVKDTRPFKDRTFITNCQHNIADFLSMFRSNINVTQKTLTSPTGKEFQDIFKFLINFLVDGFTWGKSFEQDAFQLLKDLKYPSSDNCGKTAISAPGTPNHWPNMLAMLNWLVDLCKAHENWMSPDVVADPLLMPASEMPIDHPCVEERMFWEHAAKAYTIWFDEGAEDFPEAEAELAEFYDKLTQATFEESEKLESQIQRLTVDLNALRAQEPPLKVEQDTYLYLTSDKTKFMVYMEQMSQKHEKILQTITKSKALCADQERNLEQLRADLATIEAQVAAQNLSPEEVSRMNHERETLTRQLNDLRAKIHEASQASSEHELMVSRNMDRFHASLGEYSDLGHRIGTIAGAWDGPTEGPGGVDFSIDLDLATDDMNEVQACGKRMREVIRPALGKYDEDIRSQTRVLGEEQSKLESEFDKLALVVEKQKGDVGNKELELSKRLEEAESAKASHNAALATAANGSKKLEDTVINMKAQISGGLIEYESKVENTRIGLQELKRKTAMLQDNIVAQMTIHMDAICKAKTHVDKTLKSVRQYAETQN